MNNKGKHPNFNEWITRRNRAAVTQNDLLRVHVKNAIFQVKLARFHESASFRLHMREKLDDHEHKWPAPNLAEQQDKEHNSRPPPFGEFLLSILTPIDKQKERIADFEEIFVSVWVPKFGARRARLIYMWQAGGVLVRTAFVAWILERFSRAMGS